MHFNYLALAIPLFLMFMIVEFLYAKKKGGIHFNLHNSIANISIGIAERLTDTLIAGLLRIQKCNVFKLIKARSIGPFTFYILHFTFFIFRGSAITPAADESTRDL